MVDSDQIPLSKMSPNIAGAVVKVMGALGTLEKDQKNKFDNYDYASIDDFILFVRKHCVDAGLFIIANEAHEPVLKDTKKKDGSPLMMWWSRFAFTLCHTDGEMFGPIYKTVMVQANGARAAGSAQSYALKQLMRGLFQIPTGDKDDPDKSTAEISAEGERPTDLQKEANRIRNALKRAKNPDELNEVWEANSLRIEEIRDTSETAYDALKSIYDKTFATFGAAA